MKREPLRVPKQWQTQDRAFVIQLERVLDDICARIEALGKRVKALEEAAEETEETQENEE